MLGDVRPWRRWDTRAVPRPSVFDVAGGEPAFLALAAATHERCLADPVLAHPFSHGGLHPEHVERLARYWAEVFGGPPWYSAQGGHPRMLSIHAGEGAEADLGARFVRAFELALDDASLPEDDDLRTTLRRYIAWATDEVLAYSPAGSIVPGDLAMPRWGWDGLETR
jgi:hemoglobin